MPFELPAVLLCVCVFVCVLMLFIAYGSLNFSVIEIGYHRNSPEPESRVSCVSSPLQCSISETVDSADSIDARRMDMIYTIEDTPPWYLCVFLGLQVQTHAQPHVDILA